MPCRNPGLRCGVGIVGILVCAEQLAEPGKPRHMRNRTAVDHQIVSRDVTRRVGSEKCNRIGNVFGDPEIRSERFAGDDFVQLRGQVVARRGSHDEAGRHRIAADSPPAMRGRYRARQLDDRGFGRSVGRLAQVPLHAEIGGGVDDRTALVVGQRRRFGMGRGA